MRSTCILFRALASWLALASLSAAQQPGSPPAAAGATRSSPNVRTESQPPAADIYYEEGAGGDVNYMLGESCGPGGCNFCGNFGCTGCGPFGQGCLSGLYVRGEYLLWGTRGMNLPALITRSPEGTPREDAGVLGEEGTEILFGGRTSGSDMRSGGRITFGRWFDPCQRLGIEADYFALADERNGLTVTSDGDPIISRPFYDVTTGQNSAELGAFPNILQGTVSAEHVTRLQGTGVRAMYNLACGDGCGTSCLTHCQVPTGYRFDALLGWRFLRLDDEVHVIEDLVSLDSTQPAGAFIVRDGFQTENHFHGVDFGTSVRFCKGCFTLDLLSKLALGNTRSRIAIAGSTVITESGQSETFQGGLLAQRTNIGEHTFNEFAAVPELGATIGYQVNPCWRLTFGYSFIYWSRVVRAGDVINLDVNPNLLPPEDPAVTTHLRPDLRFCYTDFWAQGMNFGIEGKW